MNPLIYLFQFSRSKLTEASLTRNKSLSQPYYDVSSTTSSRNDLPRRPLKRECGILNLDGVSGRGTHWVSWYKNNDNFYFDSLGVLPPNELIEYFSSPILYNSEKIQPDGEVVCGHLCLYVLYRLSRGEGFQEIINDLY